MEEKKKRKMSPGWVSLVDTDLAHMRGRYKKFNPLSHRGTSALPDTGALAPPLNTFFLWPAIHRWWSPAAKRVEGGGTMIRGRAQARL